MEKAWIGLLDCNNFFVSCERLFRPELQNRPVVVLSSNDGCVVARSQEIKDMNVPMGVPYFQIKDILEKTDAVTFSSHFALYRDISRRVFTVMREELGVIDQYSIDEAFFTLTSDPENVARQLKDVVQKKVGMPVSVGIAKTKTQAKYANVLAKKGSGVCVLNEQDWLKLTPEIKIEKIWGVGGKSEIKYKQHGLNTVADLLAADSSRVSRLFGVAGVRLRQELMGNSVYEINAKTAPQKSILSSRSFSNPTMDKEVLADSVAYHVRHAMEELRSIGMETSSIRVAIRPSRHGDFVLRGGSKEAVLTIPTDDSIQALKEANKLLQSLFEPDVPYKKVGVTLSQFQPVGHGQSNLFEKDLSPDKNGLMEVVDNLNKRVKKEAVLLGSRLLNSSWQSKSEVRSPAYTTRWSEVVKVKAN